MTRKRIWSLVSKMKTRNPALREDMHDAILDAALRLIERYGYRKTTMEDLARETGIGKGTIYLYFPSKGEVALSCMDRTIACVFEQLRAIAGSDTSPAERLRKMLIARVMIRYDSVSRSAHTLDELMSALRPAVMARRERYLAEEAKIFAEVLIEGRLLGAFSVEDAVRTAETLLLATNGLMPMVLSPRELQDREDVHQKAARIADSLMQGILRR